MESVNIEGRLTFFGTNAERIAQTGAGQKGSQFWETDTGIRYESDGTVWRRLGGSRAITDDNGNTITPAFSPGTPIDLSATALSQVQALSQANSVEIVSKHATVVAIRVKFGSSAGISASATTDKLVIVGKPGFNKWNYYIPPTSKNAGGQVWMAFIADSAETPPLDFQVCTG